MPWPLLLVLAVLLDTCVGDPRWRFHPTRLIGCAALALEAPLRRWLPRPRLAGVLMVICVVGGSMMLAAIAVQGLLTIAQVPGEMLAVVFVYFTIAGQDMLVHANAVLIPLQKGDLPVARTRVAMIVGRDTHALDARGIVRATIESVAESLVDGVTAPLFWAWVGGLLGGVPGMVAGAFACRAANTLDSTFGYTTDAYIDFGWASAKFDDLVNWLPARLTPLSMALVLIATPKDLCRMLRVWWRDGGKHESPNAGQCEAAMAGALGVQLGGPCAYAGEMVQHPYVGEAEHPLGLDVLCRALHVFRYAIFFFTLLLLFFLFILLSIKCL